MWYRLVVVLRPVLGVLTDLGEFAEHIYVQDSAAVAAVDTLAEGVLYQSL